MSELDLDRTLRKGDRGKRVRRVQEWISLRGTGLATDGQFGPATEYGVRTFQRDAGQTASGIVGQGTFAALVEPMRRALRPPPAGASLGSTVVTCAEQHLEQNPREIGGQNRGPWVRLYMGGNEGGSWPWCAGFVCHVLEQARAPLGVPMPIQPSYSCDSLAASAKETGRFLPESSLDPAELRPGMLFLSRRTSTDWTHVGIVVDVTSIEEGLFLTIEGNTNDDGDREGYEVCRRIRGLKDKDFIRID